VALAMLCLSKPSRGTACTTFSQLTALEGELAASQREAGEAKQELQRQVAAHEAETSAAAARITGARWGRVAWWRGGRSIWSCL